MCTFLAINTSSVQLIPVTAIAILAANHSGNPTAIVGTSIIATTCAAISAVMMAKILARLPMFVSHQFCLRSPLGDSRLSEEKVPIKEAAALKPLEWWGRLILSAFGIFFLLLFLRLAFPALLGHEPSLESTRQTVFVRIVDAISKTLDSVSALFLSALRHAAQRQGL